MFSFLHPFRRLRVRLRVAIGRSEPRASSIDNANPAERMFYSGEIDLPWSILCVRVQCIYRVYGKEKKSTGEKFVNV